MINNTNAGAALENNNTDNLDQIVEGLDAGEDKVNNIKQEDQEKSPYELELERLKAENAKKDELIAHKNRAIAAMKKEKVEVPAEPITPEEETITINGIAYTKTQVEAIKAITKEENDQLRSELSIKERELMLNSLVSDPKERELVQFHLDNTLKGSSAPLAENIANARLLANRNAFLNPEEENENRREELIASFAAGTVSGSKNISRHSDPVNKQAAEILRSAGFGAVADKYISKN